MVPLGTKTYTCRSCIFLTIVFFWPLGKRKLFPSLKCQAILLGKFPNPERTNYQFHPDHRLRVALGQSPPKRFGAAKRWDANQQSSWVFPKIGVLPPKSSHFNRVFHYKPSILGYHYFWKHPVVFSSYWGYPPGNDHRSHLLEKENHRLKNALREEICDPSLEGKAMGSSTYNKALMAHGECRKSDALELDDSKSHH